MNKQFHNVALGQGQDVIAMNKLEIGHKEGHCVMLQNIHLIPKWLLELERSLTNLHLKVLIHPLGFSYLLSQLIIFLLESTNDQLN